jgi:hypothetical protein
LEVLEVGYVSKVKRRGEALRGERSEPQIDKIEPSAPTKIPFWRLVFDQGVVTQEIIDDDALIKDQAPERDFRWGRGLNLVDLRL